MSGVLRNTLTGPVGDTLSSSALSRSGDPLTVLTPARSRFDDTHTVHGLPSSRLGTGHHRGDTARIRVPSPGSVWALRAYLWLPTMPSGDGSRHWALTIGDADGLVLSTATNGSVNAVLQGRDLAAEERTGSVSSGSGRSPGTNGWIRLELRRSANLALRLYDEHETERALELTWPSAPNGDLLLTGFRYRARATLYWGDQGTAVRDLQRELLDLGYDLGVWGADGDFGNATRNAVMAFQDTHGLDPVDGIPGPETRAAMDLALGNEYPPLWWSHLAVSDGDWLGPAPAPEVRRAPLVPGLPL